MTRTLGCVLAFGATFAAMQPAMAATESAFEGRFEIGVEAERKKCTSCAPDEYENEIELTVLDLILSPKARKDLSFGLTLEYETESDDAFWGSGRSDIVNNTGVGLWARRDFDNGVWARAQAAFETDEKFLDLGGRVGFSTDVTEIAKLDVYANLDRRFPWGDTSRAAEGTYLELGGEIEWDWDSYGAWVELEASKWFFDPGTKADETELIVQPGVWFDLGESDHVGLIWLEGGQKKLTGARLKEERYRQVGVGGEFGLTPGANLFVGVTYGREITQEPGDPDEKANIYGLELAFEKRF